MLAQILEDMCVEPEVLEALGEEQKRILFFKMREEQVRRWREREEREEENTKPKIASRKRVSWLLGRDGDVSVSIIGELDEFRSSKLLQNLSKPRLHSDVLMVELKHLTRFNDDLRDPAEDSESDNWNHLHRLHDNQPPRCCLQDRETQCDQQGGAAELRKPAVPRKPPHLQRSGLTAAT